jgi:hypothetical protein
VIHVISVKKKQILNCFIPSLMVIIFASILNSCQQD